MKDMSKPMYKKWLKSLGATTQKELAEKLYNYEYEGRRTIESKSTIATKISQAKKKPMDKKLEQMIKVQEKIKNDARKYENRYLKLRQKTDQKGNKNGYRIGRALKHTQIVTVVMTCWSRYVDGSPSKEETHTMSICRDRTYYAKDTGKDEDFSWGRTTTGGLMDYIRSYHTFAFPNHTIKTIHSISTYNRSEQEVFRMNLDKQTIITKSYKLPKVKGK